MTQSQARRGPLLVATLVAVLCGLSRGDDPPAKSKAAAPIPADFKLKIKLLGPAPKPLGTAELLYHEGVFYHFASDSNEILIIEPARKRVELLDLKRRLSTQVSFRRLDEHLARLRSALDEAVKKREKSEARADRIAAEQSRSLIDPGFKWTLDPTGRILSAGNAHVDVRASGEPEPEAPRLAAIRLGLETLMKLGALRDPTSLPPFYRLETIETLSAKHGLRPIELNFLLRLSGPSQRLRWSYEFVDQLTDREREAFARIARLRDLAAGVRFERYDSVEPPK